MGPAQIDISSPEGMQGRFLGLFGTFSGGSGLKTKLRTWTPPGNTKGCTTYQMPGSPEGPSGLVAIVERGGCTFVKKTREAQLAGAAGIFIVSDTDDIVVMAGGNTTDEVEEKRDIQIFAVSMQNILGKKIIEWNADHSLDMSVSLSVKRYTPPQETLFDPSLGVELVVATSLVVAGAFLATADLRPGSPWAPKVWEEVLHIEGAHAFIYCLIGSGMLVVLFFFMKYLIYVIMAAFCFGGAGCIQQMVSAILQYSFPRLRQPAFIVAEEQITSADLLAVLPAAFLVIGWLWFRNTEYGFIYQNTIGAGLLCMIQRQVRLPNLKVAAIVLATMFCFDVFWVFLSPMFFRGKSVMVEVAKGGGTQEAVPMLIRVPTVGESHGGERMLGFGDIALPGLLVSYLLRYDMLEKKGYRDGYFLFGVLGYLVGLIVTSYVLIRTHTAQPALLYLVPGTLLPALSLGWCRGDLRTLWEGSPHGHAPVSIEETETELQEVLGAVIDGSPRAIFRAKLCEDPQLST